MISLARFIDEHGEAIGFDLITKTNFQIDDIGGALTWSSLDSFIKNLGGDSALARDLGKATGWETTTKTNAILADIYDLLQVINANLISFASNGKKKTKIKPYPRPGRDEDIKRKIGREAMPLDELRKWLKNRRMRHG